LHEWSQFIFHAISSHIDEFSDADYGTVLLRFVVDTSGNITDLRPLTKKYSTLAKIAFNAIDSGPKWTPAERNGKKVKTIRIQPVTLQDPDKR
jgi:protein TonB